MKVPPPQEPVDWDEAVRLRTEACLSYAEIARRLGRSPGAIREGLIARGAPALRSSERRKKDTKRGKRLYWMWARMRRRARDSAAAKPAKGRPLRICKAWDRFEAFHDWAVGAAYRKGMVLALREGRTLFSPANCVFETSSKHSSRTSTRAHGRKRRNSRAADVDWERARRLYAAEGWAKERIATEFGVSVKTIARGFKKHGIERPARTPISRLEHGLPLYKCWHAMRQHCENPQNHAYRWYGAKGARVAEEWQSFPTFHAWALGSGYEPGLALSRIDRKRPYSSSNCAWRPRGEATRRAAHPPRTPLARWLVKAFGETKGPTEWSRDRRCLVSLTTLCKRLREGWPPESALSTPRSKPGLTGLALRPVRAFGRVQSVAAWGRDPRCSVRPHTIVLRIERGIDPETAITAPPFRCPGPRRQSPSRKPRAKRR